MVVGFPVLMAGYHTTLQPNYPHWFQEGAVSEGLRVSRLNGAGFSIVTGFPRVYDGVVNRICRYDMTAITAGWINTHIIYIYIYHPPRVIREVQRYAGFIAPRLIPSTLALGIQSITLLLGSIFFLFLR